MDSSDKWKRSFEPVAQPAATAQPTFDSTTASAAAPASVVHRPLPLPQQQAVPPSSLPTVVPHQTQRARAWAVDPSPAVEPRPMDRAESESAGTRGAVGTTSGTLNLDVDRWLEEACRGPSGGRNRSASSSTTPAAEDIKPWLNELHGAEANRARKSFKPRLPPPPPALQPKIVQGKSSAPAFKSRLPPSTSAPPTSTATSAHPPTTIVQPLPQPAAAAAPVIAEPTRSELPARSAPVKRVELPPKPSPAVALPPNLPQCPPPAGPHGLPDKPVMAPQPASNGQLAPQSQPADSSAPSRLAPPPSVNAPVGEHRELPASFSTVDKSSTSSQAEARPSPSASPQPAPPPPPPPSQVKHIQTESTPQPQEPTTSKHPSLSSKEKAFALLPQDGTEFTSSESFYTACYNASIKAFRLSTWKNTEVSTLRAECSLRQRKNCRFSIAAVRSQGKWVVSNEKSRLEHNHVCEVPLDEESEEEDSDDEGPLVQRPPQRISNRGSTHPDPIAGSSSSSAHDSPPRSPSEPSTSSNTSPRIFPPLDPHKPAPPMVKIGDTFDSRFAIHCAASKAAYARGFAIVVSKSLGDGSILGFSCRRGVNQSGLSLAERCHFKLDVEVTEDDDGEEEWKVIRLDEEHNHSPSTQAALGEWKEPRGEQRPRNYPSRAGADGSDSDDFSSEEGSSEDGESSDEEFKPSRKRRRVQNVYSEEEDSSAETRSTDGQRSRASPASSPTSIASLQPLDPSSVARPLPQVGGIFSSRALLHTAASKAGYDRGFVVLVYKVLREGRFVLGCKYSVKSRSRAGAKPCPFRIMVKVTTGKDGEERWGITRVVHEHNHRAHSKQEMGAWKPPCKPRPDSGALKAKKRNRDAEDDEESDGSSGSEARVKIKKKRQRSSSTSGKRRAGNDDSDSEDERPSSSSRSPPPHKKRRASSSLPTPRLSKTPPAPTRRPQPDAPFLPSLTSFLIALAPSLGQFAPILLSLGVDSVEAVMGLILLDEGELERFVKMDRRGDQGREGGVRSLTELPPMERAKLKSGLKKGRAWVEVCEGVGM
ncbi:hypothetical protein BCR35DRAFT_325277 [Leucosporidium creatinivorum]|uniref:FAR1 domain-containing protein n=1 Tax=Leucosporidium creatinivorum TaxID=106004 RepID=A0A1Y2F7C6_9BASI|nr:hypothetical protein BCR35DRAFT_325277 [Leucosporidium creatinivorum]